MSSSTSTVSLYRYDLTMGMARSMGPMLIGRPLEGIWHTSIVVFGKEYYFDGGVGIMADPNPGRTRFGTPYRTEVLGTTTKSQNEFFAWTQRQRSAGFGPNDYHLLNNNCNSFSDAASMFLLNRHIPQDILEMIPMLLSSPMGQMLRPMLEQATSGGSPGMGVSPTAPSQQPAVAPFAFTNSSSAASPTVSNGPGASAGASASAASRSGETCVGLLNTRQTVTESEEEDLMLAQVMLESNETIADGPDSPPENFEKAISGLTLLQTVMANICDHPTEPKYRALSMESNAYKTKLKPLEPYGVTEVLRIAGFVRRPHSSGSAGEQWYLSDAAGSAVLLQRVGEMLAITISSIEGAAADAAKERAKRGSAAPASVGAEVVGEGSPGILKSPPPPPTHLATPTPGASASAALADARPEAAGAASEILRYCYPPFPKEWAPFSVGWEGGAPLFSIHCLAGHAAVEGPYCFGKCRLSPNQQHLQAYYCSSDGREVEVRGGYEVLCVRRGQESRLSWVPARLACAAASGHAKGDSTSCSSGTARNSNDSTSPASAQRPFIFFGYGRFGVARAEHGCGVQPGVLEPAGRCVIPYGGRAVVVTGTAEVLCETARLPPALAQQMQVLKKGAELSKVLREAGGQPIGSFEELLHRWQPPLFYPTPPPPQHFTRQTAAEVNWHDAASEGGAGARATGAESSTRLLVCHDFGGGYTAGERPLYVLEESDVDGSNRSDSSSGNSRPVTGSGSRKARTEPDVPQKRIAAVEGAYTVGYWDRTDCFVYFTHQRVSVPPREWIRDGHRHGATVLGTVLTEGAGGAADLDLLLSDAKRMAAVIERLVQLCDVYGFDGYLLNVENNLAPTMAKRLVVFCTQLRKQLNLKARAGVPRRVIWYDAITIDGNLAYQNALTPRNKPFFDVCDGLFTNYFWNPVHIALTRTAAGPRGADVYVGVDVFGRHMFGGGGYNTCVAAEEAVHADLSVALFAPGWTMECESHGSRDGFAQAESRLWSRLQSKFAERTRMLSCAEAHTAKQQQPQGGLQEQRTRSDSQCNISSSSNSKAGLRAWTAFLSGVGYHFYVNGRRVTRSALRTTTDTSTTTTTTSAWCALSDAHALPPFQYEAPPNPSSPSSAFEDPRSVLKDGAAASLGGPFAVVPLRLVVNSLQGSMYGGGVRAAWRYDKAWFGDRCLACMLPPMEAAVVWRCYVPNALPAASSASPTMPASSTPAPSSSSPSVPSLLHVEAVLSYAEVAAVPVGVGSGSSSSQRVETQGGLRLGLFSASRGAFFANVWKTPVSEAFTPVYSTGAEGLEVRVSVTHYDERGAPAAVSSAATSLPAASSRSWRRVHCELRNTSSEAVHLTSISVANGDPGCTLRLCVGAVGFYHAPAAAAVAAPHTMDEAETAAVVERSVLHAAGPYVWAAHVMHPTGKGAEQVLSLEKAQETFTQIRGRHGESSALVVFASIAPASVSVVSSSPSAALAENEVEQQTAHASSSVEARNGDHHHHMYLGQYSVDPADATSYKDAVLIPVSLPAGRVVKQVYYYVVPSGY